MSNDNISKLPSSLSKLSEEDAKEVFNLVVPDKDERGKYEDIVRKIVETVNNSDEDK